jgi:molybdate transport system substrate-binding protein
VRAGDSKPDVSTVDAFKQAMLKAKTIAVPGSTSGIWLKSELFPRLAIAEKINLKMTSRGTGATGMVAAGEADLAVMPVSEILHAERKRPPLTLFRHSTTAGESPLDGLLLSPRRKAYQPK